MTGHPPPPPPPESVPEPDPRLRGFQRREVEIAAAKQGLTPEEYGNYKGRYPGVAQPVRSAGAILTLCILVTVISVIITVGAVRSLIHASDVEPWKLIVVAVVLWVVTFFGWRSFRIEHRAEKLRKARGLLLQPPSDEDNRRPQPWFHTMLPGGRPGSTSTRDPGSG